MCKALSTQDFAYVISSESHITLQGKQGNNYYSFYFANDGPKAQGFKRLS